MACLKAVGCEELSGKAVDEEVPLVRLHCVSHVCMWLTCIAVVGWGLQLQRVAVERGAGACRGHGQEPVSVSRLRAPLSSVNIPIHFSSGMDYRWAQPEATTAPILVVAKRPFMGAEPVLVDYRHAPCSGRVRDGLPLGPPGDSDPTKGTAVELRGAHYFRGLLMTRALGRLSVRGC